MKKVLIFGVNSFSDMLYHYLKADGFEIVGFVSEKSYMPNDHIFCRLPVYCLEDVFDRFSANDYKFYICIGYSKMNSIRERIFLKIKSAGYEISGYIHRSATVLASSMGEGNIVLENVTIGYGCTIGKGNIFYPCSHIAHHSSVGDFNFFAVSCCVAGKVNIQNNCFFGNNCTVKNRLNIADQTLVGAGAYLAADTKQNDVWVPERSILLQGKNSIDLI